MLARLLELRGIESVVIERRDREYVQQRVRAGVLEQATMDLMDEVGLGERMHAEGLVHEGVELRFDGEGHRIALSELTGGRAITIYGQQEVVKDLIEARLESGLPLLFEVSDVEVDPSAPRVTFTHEGESHVLDCDVIAGCDGFHGVCRPAIADVLTVYEREYPFGWLGILAHCAPSSEELIYAHHERGFALASMRSHEITRMYLQCEPDEDASDWSDAGDLGRARPPLRHAGQPRRRVREGRHADALVRGRADAARAAVPGRRRGPHRPAHRGQGPEHRDGRRLPARPRARCLLPRRLIRPGAVFRRARWSGSGASSTSRGG